MSLFKALRKADEEKDIEAYMSLHHEDFEFVRHQTGSTKMIENGQVIRSESGATPMK